jgi:hypothetical protein
MRLAQSAIPGGAIGIPALQALGIIPGGNTTAADSGAASEGETWERFAEFAQEVYETAADQVNPATLNPLSAMSQAGKVIENVVRQNQGGFVQRTANAVMAQGQGLAHGGGKRRRIIRVRPGESVLLVCK